MQGEGMRPLGACLVTGGRGWVGARLVQRLAGDAELFGVTRLLSADLVPVATEATHAPRAEEIVLDVCDARAVEKLFRDAQIDTVFHLAAVIDLRLEDERFAQRCLRVNVEGSLNVAAALLEHSSSRGFTNSDSEAPASDARAPRMVHVSSHDAAYFAGRPANARASPPADLQVRAACPYARSKALAERQLLDLFARTHARSLQTAASLVTIRPTHVVDFGARAGADPVFRSLWGSGTSARAPLFRLRAGSGRNRMSMVSVGTLVEALVRAARARQGVGDGRGGPAASPTYYVKDLDWNFFDFYFGRMPGRGAQDGGSAWGISIPVWLPAWLLLAVAVLADAVWGALYTLAGLERHPFLGLRRSGVELPLAEMTSDDADARRDLGYSTSPGMLALVGGEAAACAKSGI